MRDKIEISEYGSLLVYKRSYSPDFVRKTIKTQNLKGLRIFAELSEDRISDVRFLRDYSFLEALDLTSRDDYDFSFLKKLVNLKKLSIFTHGNNPIDLSRQTNLKYLAIQWRKGGIQGIDSCSQLTELCLVEFTGDDFSPISGLTNLEILRVKTASLKSVDGISGLQCLEQLALGNCRRLVSIAALKGLRSLQNLRIESCKKIEDYDLLDDLPRLEKIELINCGLIRSFPFRENIPSLQNIDLVGDTKIST